ncbi:MAG: methyl-accepting chemotaxis protein [Spirochaetales bacterium]|nr:methyl-accepting chemotaxis protein [Spirochaetales bacterium]
MTIKTKLLSLVTGFLVLVCLIIGLYFMIMAPIDEIRKEQQILSDLKDSMQTERILMNKMLGQAPYVRMFEDLLSSIEATNDQFERLESITLLREMSVDISDSIDIILRLNAMKLDRLESFKKADASFRKSVEETYIFINSFSFTKIYNAKRFRDLHGTQADARFGLSFTNFLSQHSIYENVLESSVNVINEQFQFVDAEIKKIEERSLLLSFIGLVVILILVFLGAIIFTNQIVRNIKSIEGSIGRLKDGDLREVGKVTSKDDLARLNSNLSTFQNSIKGIIDRIKGVSDENLSIRDQLIKQVEDTTQTSRSIGISAQEIKADVHQLDETSKSSYEAVEVISSRIENLNQSILEQTSMIEESSAAVNQMMASIANVEQVTVKKLGSLESMVSSMDEGNHQLKDTTDTITRINNSIDAIRNMISVIEDISSQTNLLSMNAAIEAAHAGEYGKGFAVVSDEIRKLAEASSQNSREIGSSLNEIIENIRAATESSDVTLSTFTKTVSEVEDLFSSMNEIGQSMVELKSGGDQILSAMSSLQTMSVEVRQDSESMTEQSQTMIQAVESVQAISGSVNAGVNQVSSGIETISGAIDRIQNMTDTIGSVAERIGSELQFFKTDAADLEESDPVADFGGDQTLDTAEMVVEVPEPHSSDDFPAEDVEELRDELLQEEKDSL